VGLTDGFRQIGPDHYTCVPVPGFEKDPAVTAAVREFDPGLIPIWRVQTWGTPGSFRPLQVVHHGIGRYYPVPRYMRRSFRVDLPANDHSEPPNFLDAILEDQSTEQYRHQGGPGGYLPWDWSFYRWCRWMFNRITEETWQRFAREKQEREKREYEHILAEIEGKRKELEPYLLRKANEVSEYGWKQYLRFMDEQAARKAAGLKPQPFGDRRPFVTVGRSPRTDKTFGRVAPAQDLGETHAGS
jgi:hypothetical protein